MTILSSYGLTPALSDAFAPHAELGRSLARVVAVHRGVCRVVTETGEHDARLRGRLRRSPAAELPTVGDWVAISPSPPMVEAVLPRRGALVRRAAGEADVEQVLAAHLDSVLLVMGLDGDFNLRRLDRFLALVGESGIAPVILLSKADLCADVDDCRRQAERHAPGLPVLALSALTGAGIDGLSAWLRPSATVALLGSSGVGKSTLVNRLIGAERFRTAATRESDGRGRHTTSHRELVTLPGGALVIDTPGLREVALWVEEREAVATFDDIAELAGRCRFRDCRHEREPGCAVQAAAESGGLAPERLESFRTLGREARALQVRNDERARAEKRQQDKSTTRALRAHYRGKKS